MAEDRQERRPWMVEDVRKDGRTREEKDEYYTPKEEESYCREGKMVESDKNCCLDWNEDGRWWKIN